MLNKFHRPHFNKDDLCDIVIPQLCISQSDKLRCFFTWLFVLCPINYFICSGLGPLPVVVSTDEFFQLSWFTSIKNFWGVGCDGWNGKNCLRIAWCFYSILFYTVKPLNSGNIRILKNLPIIKRCPLLGGSLTKIVTFGTKNFVPGMSAIWDLSYWEVSLHFQFLLLMFYSLYLNFLFIN